MLNKDLADTKVQRKIEKYIFHKMKKRLSCENLQSNATLMISEENNIWICPDFYSEKDRIIGEIHTHLGRLKPAQLHKIKGDILKMLLWEKCQGETKYTKIIVVCNMDEFKQLQGKSFVAEAIRQFDIKLEYVPLEKEQIVELEKAMRDQNLLGMIN